MVESRQEARGSRMITELAFTPPVGTSAGVEVLSLADLRARVGPERLAGPSRHDFHVLVTLTSGSLRQTVDFTRHTLSLGSWLWVRPGQVHQWGDITQAEGTLILFERDFPDPATAAAARLDEPHAPVVRTPNGEDIDALNMAAHHLDREFHSPIRMPVDVHVAVERHLLAVLVLRLAHLAAPAGGTAPEPDSAYVRFRDAVEREFAGTRCLEDYARALGYSARTLSRATLAAAGVGAKEFIDRRVVLEAKRMLAHSDLSAAGIAAQLGFSSATNFSKYFHKHTGQTPIGFRRSSRGRHHHAPYGLSPSGPPATAG
ncbi:helix-turn-helix domain-containing protein [Streptomyces lunaelactis]|uniref:helix-turn-helix domain-containing protein n=1 Tax=Streptomyces lunaelactis TaxID=1535768 RepID=UPI001584B4D5|nr:helix-turn-helix domain-containing protein [Streptomyces lunaelactis]NUK23229.1 AraC family transcriptional regulator [Streptomyces lunaelactis]